MIWVLSQSIGEFGERAESPRAGRDPEGGEPRLTDAALANMEASFRLGQWMQAPDVLQAIAELRELRAEAELQRNEFNAIWRLNQEQLSELEQQNAKLVVGTGPRQREGGRP